MNIFGEYNNNQNQYDPSRNVSMTNYPPHPDGSDWQPSGRPKKKKKSMAGVVIACTISAGLIGGLAGGAGGVLIGYKYAPTPAPVVVTQQPAASQSTPVPTEYVPSSLSGQALSYSQIAQIVSPSVVGITTSTTNKIETPFGSMESQTPGAGSGVIISEDGYIVTNNHVIENATQIKVFLDDGTEYEATLVGRDSQTDIAVLKIEAENLPAVIMGNSSDLKVGDVAIAVGNPLGQLQGTVTQGIISALNREITFQNDDGTQTVMNLLQTDAAINKGNSGGALVNAQGQLIGVVNAKNQGVGVEGLGFAIPIDDVRNVINDLVSNGYVTGRPKIGIGIREVTEEISKQYRLPVGVYIAQVEEFSAAEMAGLRVGDVIVAIQGQEVKTADELNAVKDTYKVGDSISLTIMRNGEKKEVTLTLQESIPNN